MINDMRVHVHRVYAGIEEFVITIEYSKNSDQSTFRENIFIDTLTDDTDLIQLADDVIDGCSILNEFWRNDVIDALYNLQKNDSSNKRSKNILDRTNYVDSNLKDTVDRLIEMTYGKYDEKAVALTSILHLCQVPRHLAIMIHHPTLMPALARLLGTNEKLDVAVTTLEIILCFSTFSDFHGQLVSCHIGVSIMTALQKIVDQIKNRAHLTNASKYILASLIVLDHLSDNPTLLRKMIRRGLIHILFACLEINDITLLQIVSKLLLKISVYDELVAFSSSHQKWKSLQLLLEQDMTTQQNAILILYNMTFFDSFHRVTLIQDSGYMDGIFYLFEHARNLNECRKFLYQISSIKKIRRILGSPKYIAPIMRLFLNQFGRPDTVEICAIAHNMSIEPTCAEIMSSYIADVMKLFDIVTEGSLYYWVAKILLHLSQWTSALQDCILEACNKSDMELITAYARNVTEFIAKDPSGSRGYSSRYQEKKYWESVLVEMIKVGQSPSYESCLLEVLATIANMTVQDLPQGCTWHDVYSKHHLLDLLSGLISNGPIRPGLKRYVVEICRKTCVDEEIASLLSSLPLRSILNGLWEDQYACLPFLRCCQTFMKYNATRSIIFSDKVIFEAMITFLNSDDCRLHQETERCIELIKYFDRDDHGEYGEHAKVAHSSYFEMYNQRWLSKVQLPVRSDD